MALFRVLFALLLLASPLLGASLSFNSTVAEYCTAANGGCSFYNSSIWNNATVPSTSDSVNITSTNYTVLIYLPTNNSLTLSSLNLNAVHFVISAESKLNVTSSLSVPDGTFEVAANGSFFAPSNSWLTFSELSSVNISGSFFANGTSELYSLVTVYPTASVTLNGVWLYSTENINIIQNNITIANLTVPSGVVLFDFTFTTASVLNIKNFTINTNSSVVFRGAVMLPQLYVAQGAMLYIDSANGVIGTNSTASSLTGSGSIAIHNSHINITTNSMTPSVFYGSIDINGSSVFNAKQFVVTQFELAPDTVVNGDGLVLNGSYTQLSGNWNAIGSGINITGVWAVLSDYGSFNVVTRLVIGPNCNFTLNNTQLTISPNSSILFAGHFRGNVHVLPTTTFEVYDGSDVTIFGNLQNDGTLVLNGEHPLHINGAAVFGVDGAVHASLYKDNNNLPVMVVTNNNLTLGGSLSYNMVDAPLFKNEDFLLAQTTSVPVNNVTVTTYVNGGFNGTASYLEGSKIERALNIKVVNSNSVYIEYKYKLFHDTPVWVWVVFSLVVVVLVAGVIAVIVKCRSRREYQPVP